MGSTAIASVANALTPASPLVFVYNSTTGCSSSASKTTHGAFLFESKLASLFAQGFMRTHNPAAATIFYHPACLVDVFFNLRHRHDAPARAADIERTILADIARVGYSKTPHVVNSLRCFTANRRRRHGHDHLFQTLWADPFLNFCAEAFPTLDANRSIYLPYCRAQPAPPPAFQPTRPIRALFIGSVPSHERAGTRARRQSSVAALRRLAGAHVELISTHSDDVSVRALSLMRQAVYTLCPYGDPTPMLHPTRTHTHSRHTDSHTLTLTLTHPFPHSGDTPESRRIYQALSGISERPSNLWLLLCCMCPLIFERGSSLSRACGTSTTDLPCRSHTRVQLSSTHIAYAEHHLCVRRSP